MAKSERGKKENTVCLIFLAPVFLVICAHNSKKPGSRKKVFIAEKGNVGKYGNIEGIWGETGGKLRVKFSMKDWNSVLRIQFWFLEENLWFEGALWTKFDGEK